MSLLSNIVILVIIVRMILSMHITKSKISLSCLHSDLNDLMPYSKCPILNQKIGIIKVKSDYIKTRSINILE